MKRIWFGGKNNGSTAVARKPGHLVDWEYMPDAHSEPVEMAWILNGDGVVLGGKPYIHLVEKFWRLYIGRYIATLYSAAWRKKNAELWRELIKVWNYETRWARPEDRLPRRLHNVKTAMLLYQDKQYAALFDTFEGSHDEFLKFCLLQFPAELLEEGGPIEPQP